MLFGAVAGVAATLAHTAVMAAAKRAGMLGEPPPRKLTRRIMTVLGHRPSGLELDLATIAAHVSYGAATGALYGWLPRRLRGSVGGVAYGVAVWGASYLGWIPKLGLMPSPSRDRPGRPTAMVLAHVAFGGVLDAALKQLIRSRGGDARHCGGAEVVDEEA